MENRVRSAEIAFCDAWLADRRRVLVRFVYALSLTIHAMALGIVPFIAEPRLLHASLTTHAAALLILLGGLAARRRAPAWWEAAACWVFFLVMGGYAGIMYTATWHLQTTRDVLLTSCTYTALSAFCAVLYPGRRRGLYVLLALVVVGAHLGMRPVAGGAIWAAIYTIFIGFTLVMRLDQDRRAQRAARADYRFRSQVAPMHIVRHATGEGADLQELFKPELKECACLSSDWRNYQELSASMSPSQLTMTLNEYYDLCQALLEKCLPKGNYYTDWIADEFFTVIYAVDGEEPARLVDAALRFGTELILAKEEFARVHGLPRAIDIGISSGKALLGLMGPEGHRKATALGEVPGRARRFQGGGKLLRKKRGDADRIIFGRECLMRLQTAYEVASETLDAGESIRDVQDREVYFLEPKPARRSAA